MSTLVYVGSVVCGTGPTSPVLQSLSWQERDDIVFLLCARRDDMYFDRHFKTARRPTNSDAFALHPALAYMNSVQRGT
jgi:hypothetical protein